MFVKNPTESLVFLSLWLIKQCSCLRKKKKTCPLQRSIAEQQSEAEHWTFKATAEPSHIIWKKQKQPPLYLVCPEQWSQCCAVPSFESAVTKYYRSWFRSDARPFLAAFLLLAAANQKHINIYLDICHAQGRCLRTTARWITSCEYNFFLPTADEITDNSPGSMNTFANILFNDYYPGRQLARKVVHPQLQSINLTLHLLSLHSRPPLLIKQRCLSGRISSAWWSPTVRPEHRERRDLGCQIVRPVRCYSSNKYGDYV